MKKVQAVISSILIAFGLLVAPMVLVTTDVGAATCANAKECIKDGASVNTGTSDTKLPELIKNIVNILLFVLGAIAVIMIVIGGIRYTLSNGDSSAITGAKNTILYAVVGLVVALLAYAIVNFVLDAF